MLQYYSEKTQIVRASSANTRFRWRQLAIFRAEWSQPALSARPRRRSCSTAMGDFVVLRAVLQQLRHRRECAASHRAISDRRKGSIAVNNDVAPLLDTPMTLTDSPKGALRNFGRMLQ
jgi:hypothetical protein